MCEGYSWVRNLFEIEERELLGDVNSIEGWCRYYVVMLLIDSSNKKSHHEQGLLTQVEWVAIKHSTGKDQEAWQHLGGIFVKEQN